MDYKKLMAAFLPLENEDVPLFGSERESERAVYGFNRMLEQFANGHDDIARIALEKIAGDYPLFVEAKHMYALSLASEGRFGKAEKLLRELLLLDLTDEETAVVEDQLAAVHQEARRQAAARKRSRNKSQQLLPVRAKLATASILEQAGSDRNVAMASEKEIEEVKRRIESGEIDDHVEVQAMRSPVRSKAGPISFLIAMLIVIAAVVYILFIMPSQSARRNNERKLFWLEQQIAGQPNSEDIQALKEAYDRFVLTLD